MTATSVAGSASAIAVNKPSLYENYLHHNGGEVYICGNGFDLATGQPVVIYRNVPADGVLWVMPLSSFNELLSDGNFGTTPRYRRKPRKNH